ncbi:MAG: hypothetical protein WCX48_07665 [Bacteroidales bacterium]
MDNAVKVFSKGDEIKNTIEEVEKKKEEFFKQIGRLKVENDWLKKKYYNTVGSAQKYVGQRTQRIKPVESMRFIEH